MNPIRYSVANLLRFSGRDRPGQFWPWAGVVLGGVFLAWMIAFFAQLAKMGPKIDQIAREHPEQVTVEQGPGHYSVRIEGHHPELMPDFVTLTYIMLAILSVAAVLLAAAVVRRLHDSDMRGWPALIPLALLIVGMAQMGSYFSAAMTQDELDLGAFGRIFLTNLAYLASLGWLVYLLVRKGTAGPNRFGDPPGRQ